jgi:uncharacterized protein (DUF1697 family)
VTLIGLIRGINVGGHKIVKMADLRGMLSDMGFENVRTLLQSGNFVIEAKSRNGGDVRKGIQAEARTKLGVDAEFFIFTPDEWQSIIENNPFPHAAAEHPSRLVVYLGRVPIEPADLEPLELHRIPSERVRAVAGAVYIDCPEGIGSSKMLSSKPWSKLTSTGTIRNWNTVMKLAALAGPTT